MAAATPKTPSDAQPTSENITYEATLNAAASASRFPAGAFLDYAGLKKILEALADSDGLQGLATVARHDGQTTPRIPELAFRRSAKLDAELARATTSPTRSSELAKVAKVAARAGRDHRLSAATHPGLRGLLRRFRKVRRDSRSASCSGARLLRAARELKFLLTPACPVGRAYTGGLGAALFLVSYMLALFLTQRTRYAESPDRLLRAARRQSAAPLGRAAARYF